MRGNLRDISSCQFLGKMRYCWKIDVGNGKNEKTVWIVARFF